MDNRGQDMAYVHQAGGCNVWMGTVANNKQDLSATQQGPRLIAFCLLPEGVLTLRARPPLEGEFVDCFQKIKLAINLLVSQPHPTLLVRVGCHPGSHTKHTHTHAGT